MTNSNDSSHIKPPQESSAMASDTTAATAPALGTATAVDPTATPAISSATAVDPTAGAAASAQDTTALAAAGTADTAADTAAPEATADAATGHPHQRIRSFVIRAGRMTTAQTRALTELSDQYLIDVSSLKPLDLATCFGRDAPLVVEIGFGMGQSFITMAKQDPLRNYLGIEVHPPGVGATMMLAHEAQLTNVRLIKYDAFEVLSHCLTPESIDILQIFFPDPWHKARHHKRRLINPEFLALVTPLLKHGGEIRLATDWQNYAEQMLECLEAAPELSNTNPQGGYIPRPDWRPLTKFEKRGERLGHGVWDLVFTRD